MLSIIAVSIIFGSIVALAALICGTVLIIIKIRSTQGPHGAGDHEETKVIQEIYQGLTKMEQRIESLETILMERQKKNGENT